MTKTELKQAMVLATAADRPAMDSTALGVFDGFSLRSFQPVHVTLVAVAMLIRWQCLQFNGQFDNEALDELAYSGRKNFIIIG